MAMVKYQRGSPLALRRKTRKFGPGALVPFTSETEKRVDLESRQRIALWLKGATRCQIWEHRLSSLQVILLFNVSTMKSIEVGWGVGVGERGRESYRP